MKNNILFNYNNQGISSNEFSKNKNKRPNAIYYITTRRNIFSYNKPENKNKYVNKNKEKIKRITNKIRQYINNENYSKSFKNLSISKVDCNKNLSIPKESISKKANFKSLNNPNIHFIKKINLNNTNIKKFSLQKDKKNIYQQYTNNNYNEIISNKKKLKNIPNIPRLKKKIKNKNTSLNNGNLHFSPNYVNFYESRNEIKSLMKEKNLKIAKLNKLSKSFHDNSINIFRNQTITSINTTKFSLKNKRKIRNNYKTNDINWEKSNQKKLIRINKEDINIYLNGIITTVNRDTKQNNNISLKPTYFSSFTTSKKYLISPKRFNELNNNIKNQIKKLSIKENLFRNLTLEANDNNTQEYESKFLNYELGASDKMSTLDYNLDSNNKNNDESIKNECEKPVEEIEKIAYQIINGSSIKSKQYKKMEVFNNELKMDSKIINKDVINNVDMDELKDGETIHNVLSLSITKNIK